ncbi:MAG: hypothetical protein Q4F99_04490, partial [bacterium]|nr:hypothetical protein [bacterium]
MFKEPAFAGSFLCVFKVGDFELQYGRLCSSIWATLKFISISLDFKGFKHPLSFSKKHTQKHTPTLETYRMKDYKTKNRPKRLKNF